MGELDRIIEVNITRQASIPSVPGFDILIIPAEFLEADVTPAFTERVRTYSGGASAIITEIGTQFGTSSNVYLSASKVLAQSPSLNTLYVGRKKTGVDGTETWTVALTDMLLENPNWYGVLPITRTLSEQQEISAWIETNKKLCCFSSSDSNIISGTGDIAEYLDTNNYERSGVLYHPDSDLTAGDPWPAEAWMGALFPKTPGSATWAYKTLSGVASYTLTSGQITTIEGKNGNYYTSVAGVDITQFGTVGTGEFFDIIRGIDKLKSTIQVNIYTVLVNTDKVPYDDSGIQLIVSEVKSALNESFEDNFILDDYVVDAPKLVDISTTDKGNRLLPDITFTATTTGAIHKVTINGVVSL